jgi:acetolactate synthase-1/2/3 large subunit
MNVYQAVVEILKREGTEFLSCFPANPLIDYAAAGDIRPILARTERTVINIADGFSRIHNGNRIGVCCMQAGPGIENAFAGVAQAYADSVPVLILPGQGGTSRTDVPPEFDASRNYQHVTKWVACINTPERAPEMLRRAYQMLRSGTPGPVMLELPSDVGSAEFGDSVDYEPVRPVRYGPDPADVNRAADLLLAAQRPVIQSGQGVLYAEATDELVELAELLQAPVMTTLPGKSSFPENHPLSLGCGTYTGPAQLKQMLAQADCLFGVGTSFTRMFLSTPVPPGKTVIHAALDERDLNKDLVLDQALMGDAKLVLQALLAAIKARGTVSEKDAAAELGELRSAWEEEWGPKLTSDETPINPYRVIHDLQAAVDVSNTIVTADSGNPRDQISPFYMTRKPNTYIGWGKSTQLGYSLGLAIGAKLAAPEKLVVNFVGDAAMGMCGMDIETSVRSQVPILTLLVNNSAMGGYEKHLPVATEKYGTKFLSGEYADLAASLGAWSVKVTDPADIIPAIKEAAEQTFAGRTALVECITCEERQFSLVR